MTSVQAGRTSGGVLSMPFSHHLSYLVRAALAQLLPLSSRPVPERLSEAEKQNSCAALALHLVGHQGTSLPGSPELFLTSLPVVSRAHSLAQRLQAPRAMFRARVCRGLRRRDSTHKEARAQPLRRDLTWRAACHAQRAEPLLGQRYSTRLGARGAQWAKPLLPRSSTRGTPLLQIYSTPFEAWRARRDELLLR